MNMNECLKYTDGNLFVRVTVERCEDKDGWVSVIAHVGDACLNCGVFYHKNITSYKVSNAMGILFGGFTKTSIIHDRKNVMIDMLFYMDGEEDFVNITLVELK